jgi:hypothetical protein
VFESKACSGVGDSRKAATLELRVDTTPGIRRIGKNAMTTTDPTMQARTADEATIANDGGPSEPAIGLGTLVTPVIF